jgi:hypothetical protein
MTSLNHLSTAKADFIFGSVLKQPGRSLEEAGVYELKEDLLRLCPNSPALKSLMTEDGFLKPGTVTLAISESCFPNFDPGHLEVHLEMLRHYRDEGKSILNVILGGAIDHKEFEKLRPEEDRVVPANTCDLVREALQKSHYEDQVLYLWEAFGNHVKMLHEAGGPNCVTVYIPNAGAKGFIRSCFQTIAEVKRERDKLHKKRLNLKKRLQSRQFKYEKTVDRILSEANIARHAAKLERGLKAQFLSEIGPEVIDRAKAKEEAKLKAKEEARREAQEVCEGLAEFEKEKFNEELARDFADVDLVPTELELHDLGVLTGLDKVPNIIVLPYNAGLLVNKKTLFVNLERKMRNPGGASRTEKVLRGGYDIVANADGKHAASFVTVINPSGQFLRTVQFHEVGHGMMISKVQASDYDYRAMSIYFGIAERALVSVKDRKTGKQKRVRGTLLVGKPYALLTGDTEPRRFLIIDDIAFCEDTPRGEMSRPGLE